MANYPVRSARKGAQNGQVRPDRGGNFHRILQRASPAAAAAVRRHCAFCLSRSVQFLFGSRKYVPGREVSIAALGIALSIVVIPSRPAVAALESTIQAAPGIVIPYPVGWYALSANGGQTVVVVGPRFQGVRPAATTVLTQGHGDVTSLLKGAAAGLGTKATLAVLGEQQLGLDRRARYYVRGTGKAAEYVMVGVAQGGGWIVTMVAIDLMSDPELRTRAEIFQAILAGIILPRNDESK